MPRYFRAGVGELLAAAIATSDAMDRNDASGWLVVCVDLESVAEGEADSIVGCYGPFDSPEEALVEAGRHQATSLDTTSLHEPGEAGWAHFVKPLYPPVKFRPSG